MKRPWPGLPDDLHPSGPMILLSAHSPGLNRSLRPNPRNLAGNPDSPQAVVFLTSIIDVIVGS